MICLHLQTSNLIGKLPHQSFDFAQKCFTQPQVFFSVVTQHWRKAIIFSKLPGFFSKIKLSLFVTKKEKNSYSQPSVLLKVLGLSYMVKTGPELTSLPQATKFSHHAVNFNGNQTSILTGFQ